MYCTENRGYIGKNPIKWYHIIIWDFNLKVKSDSRGAARYEAWLNFHDSYDISFLDFCKQSRIIRI
jgi:hypothetical protein